jgi:hypothetical protein
MNTVEEKGVCPCCGERLVEMEYIGKKPLEFYMRGADEGWVTMYDEAGHPLWRFKKHTHGKVR